MQNLQLCIIRTLCTFQSLRPILVLLDVYIKRINLSLGSDDVGYKSANNSVHVNAIKRRGQPAGWDSRPTLHR